TRPGDDVEDMVAETFSRAWRAWPRFRGGDAEARAWLLRIARNHAIAGWRRSRRFRLVAVPEDLADPGGAPEGSVGRLDLEAEILRRARARVASGLISRPRFARPLVVAMAALVPAAAAAALAVALVTNFGHPVSQRTVTGPTPPATPSAEASPSAAPSPVAA